MNEDINILQKNVEYFIDNNFAISSKIKFKAYYYRGDETINNINIIYDKENYIYCLINIPKNKEYILNEKNEYEMTITDSSYDLFFYKNMENNNINCIILLIINDININYINENYLEFKREKMININQKDIIINKLKEKIYNYIKRDKDKKEVGIKNILIGEKENNFLINKYLLENNNDNLKEQIEKLSKLFSKVIIRNEKNNNYDINNLFMSVYEVLSPSYKSMLAQIYLNQMPTNLYNLMEKYQEVVITKNDFDNYKKNQLILKKPKIKERNNINNRNKIINKRKYFRLIKKKIKNNKIFKLKKSSKIKVNKMQKIFLSERITKKIYFEIQRERLQDKVQNNNDNLVNKFIIKENGKKSEKKKSIFKCIPKGKSKEKLFIIKK